MTFLFDENDAFYNCIDQIEYLFLSAAELDILSFFKILC